MRQRCLYERDVKCPYCKRFTTKLDWDPSMPRSCRSCQIEMREMVAKLEDEKGRMGDEVNLI